MEARELRKVEEDPGTSVRIISAAEGIGVLLARRILHSDHREGVMPMASRRITFCLLVRRDLQGTVLRIFIIPMCGCMTVSTPLWHQDMNIDIPSMSGWES
jgi:hypothetical protein